MQDFSISPCEMVASTWRHRQLIAQMTKREVIGRYRGSVLGLLWSFFNPLFMLAIYTFVFSVVFKARWQMGNNSKAEFALILFSGLLIFNLFAECVNRAPSLVLSNVNYVKKVVFPLEILPWVIFGSALFHTLVSLIVWLLFYVVLFGMPHMTLLLFPIVLLPLGCFTLGLCWMLASLGIYLRDVGQIVTIGVTALMFLTPIFYPISAIPARYRQFIYINPLALVMEDARRVLIWGKLPDWTLFAVFTILSVCAAWLGFAWFQKTRKGFADVL